MKPITAMIITRLEYNLKQMGDVDEHCTVNVSIGTIRNLIDTIRELELEIKKKHAKPSYASIGKPRYYAPE